MRYRLLTLIGLLLCPVPICAAVQPPDDTGAASPATTREAVARPPDDAGAHPATLQKTAAQPPDDAGAEAEAPATLRKTAVQPPDDAEAHPATLQKTAAQPPDDAGAHPATIQESGARPPDDDAAASPATIPETAAQPPDDAGTEDPATIQETAAHPPDDASAEAPATIEESGAETDAGWFLPRAFRAVRRRLRPETPEDWSVRFDFQPGVVGKTHPLPRNSFRSYRVELVRRTDGSALWHHTYRFPSYGVGVQLADFGGRPTDRGRPVSVYGFIQTPILPPIAAVDVLTTIGMGVTSGWNPPGFEGFPFERHPTTRLTSYVDLGFQARRRLTDRLDLLAGFSLNHFSNGGVGSPNRGLTVTASRVAVQRSLGVRGPRRRREDRPTFVDRWETRLDGGFAVRGVGFFWREDRFGPRGYVQVAALKGSVWRRFYRIGQVGGGLEGSLETRRPSGTARAPDADLSGGGSVGLYTGYEQIAGPFSIYLHFGTHLARTRSDERPAPYYRVGTIMRFAERWFTDVSFRFTSRGRDFSHDYIAWHLGYRLDGLPF